jgi:hypothetical protein
MPSAAPARLPGDTAGPSTAFRGKGNMNYKTIISKTGQGAFILRTLFDLLATGGSSLREAQEHVIEAGRELDTEIRLQYIKTLTQMMEKQGLMVKGRNGRKYTLKLTEAGEQFVEKYHEEGSRWGVDIREEPFKTEAEVEESIRLHRQMASKPHLFSKDNYEEDGERFRLFWKAYKAGEMNFIGVPAGARLLRSKANPQKWVITMPEENLT